MKYCPNCHRMSKEDDFCSHCGSAVYEDNVDNSIDCSRIPGHTHEKQTFSGSENNQTYSEFPQKTGSNEAKNTRKGCVSSIVWVIVFFAFMLGLNKIFFGGLGLLFDFLEGL